MHTGEPTDVLAAFLSAARKDALEAEGADLSAAGAKKSPVPIRWTRPPPASPETLAARSRVGTVAQLLGEHIALLWTAVMLRRRVLVHAPRTRDVLLALGAAPLLAPHRQESEREHCRPLLSPGASRILALPAFAAAVEGGEGAVALESRAAAAAGAAAKGKGEGRPAPAGAGALGGAGAAAAGEAGGSLQGTAALAATRLSAAMVEAADLARAGWYVAGTTDPGLAAAAPAAWDLYVDLPRRRCVVGEGAGASFRMTVLHKRLVQAVQGAIREGRAAGAGAGSGGLDAPVAGALQAASSSLVQRLKRILAAKVTRAREAAEAEGRELEGQRASLAGVLTPGDLSAAGLEGPVLGFLWEVARAEPDIPTAALGATQVGEAEEEEGVGDAAAAAVEGAGGREGGAGASGGGDVAAAASPAS